MRAALTAEPEIAGQITESPAICRALMCLYGGAEYIGLDRQLAEREHLAGLVPWPAARRRSGGARPSGWTR